MSGKETVVRSPSKASNSSNDVDAYAVGNNNNNGSTKEDNECVVCFKNVDIYSIGECDHPVCYECSTRMRVLCGQNECPICRRVLSRVIFTYDKLPYLELEAKNRSKYYNKKHKISFYTSEIEKAFLKLLVHPCPKCDVAPYHTLHGLRNHVRKMHDLHFCDLCSEHLKIFTFERRCYTYSELNIHRTKGDPDNRSHRGHPLCEYCNKRYLDRDDLFRHLRRDHYFCHFCDADGYNEFYRDYDALAAHFRQDHFLCEEGKCATEQFVGAFRTDIDYKAHMANVHGNLLNKQQAKQTRTLQLEITLGPRGRAGHIEPGGQNMRSRATAEEPYDDAIEAAASAYMQQNQRSITIDACNEQDFPSLGGGSTGPNLSLTRPPPPSMRNRSAIAGLARTKENFPALSGGTDNSGVSSAEHRGAAPPISSVVRKAPTAATGAIPRTTAAVGGNGNTTVIHVSNRPQSQHLNSNGGGIGSAGKKAPASLDFPALPPGKQSKQQHQLKQNRAALEADMLATPIQGYMANVSAKHRSLVDPYAAAEPSNYQKFQMVHKEDTETKQPSHKAKEQLGGPAPKLTSQDFPSLGGKAGGNAKSAPTWVKPQSERKQRELENRRSKVAPLPAVFLTKENRQSNGKTTGATQSSGNGSNHNNTVNEQSGKKDKKNKERKNGGDGGNAATNKSSNNNNNNNKTYKEKNNNQNNSNNNNHNNEFKSLTANLVNSSSTESAVLMNGNETGNIDAAPLSSLRPPPGFGPPANSTNSVSSSSVKPPPGFQSNVTLNSVAKSPNNLTFTSSLGESYSIIPTHSYTQPPDAMKRNQKLFGQFKESLQSVEAMAEFRQISQSFREGTYKPNAYYEHCQAALKEQFDSIFPELLALLPDISKQQALHLVHTQRLNTLAATGQQRKSTNLEVCNICKQVLLSGDLEYHRKAHDFPALGATSGGSGGGGKTNANNVASVQNYRK